MHRSLPLISLKRRVYMLTNFVGNNTLGKQEQNDKAGVEAIGRS